MSKSWAELKCEELEAKGRENWDVDDYEAWHYCQEALDEAARDNEFLNHYLIY